VTDIGLVSVNVAQPDVIGERDGNPVLSAIGKRPVTAAILALGPANLEGDRQADPTVHGGRDKAVYAYAAEHFAPWSDELGAPVGPAYFGENLTTTGWLEADVGVGDVWAWGDALLQVVQPRWPCFKLTMRSGVPDMAKRFRRSGRTGWYLRVIRPGEVPVAGPLLILERHPAGVTILDAHRAALPGASEEEVDRVLAVPALASAWRRMLRRQLPASARGDGPR
jgi:MOSC domain-containing protein YiiM